MVVLHSTIPIVSVVYRSAWSFPSKLLVRWVSFICQASLMKTVWVPHTTAIDACTLLCTVYFLVHMDTSFIVCLCVCLVCVLCGFSCTCLQFGFVQVLFCLSYTNLSLTYSIATLSCLLPNTVGWSFSSITWAQGFTPLNKDSINVYRFHCTSCISTCSSCTYGLASVTYWHIHVATTK